MIFLQNMESDKFYKLFKFLEEKRGKRLPFEVKILYEQITQMDLFTYITEDHYWYWEADDPNKFLNAVVRLKKYDLLLNFKYDDDDVAFINFYIDLGIEVVRLGDLSAFLKLAQNPTWLKYFARQYYEDMLDYLIFQRNHPLTENDIKIASYVIKSLGDADDVKKRLLSTVIKYLNEETYSSYKHDDLFKENPLTDLVQYYSSWLQDEMVEGMIFDLHLDKDPHIFRWLDLGADLNRNFSFSFLNVLIRDFPNNLQLLEGLLKHKRGISRQTLEKFMESSYFKEKNNESGGSLQNTLKHLLNNKSNA